MDTPTTKLLPFLVPPLNFLSVICIIGILSTFWVLGQACRLFGRQSRRVGVGQSIKPLAHCDWTYFCDDTTNVDYTFRCSRPDVERARVMYIRGLGDKILRRMGLESEEFDSLPEDPYKRLEEIDTIRRGMATALKGAEESKWLKGFRSLFFPQTPEEVYGMVVDHQPLIRVNEGHYCNAWYRFNCDDLNEERRRVQHLRLLNDKLWLTIPPVDWSNDPYNYDRNWLEDPLDERERIERVRHKVQLDLQREQRWSTRLRRLLNIFPAMLDRFCSQSSRTSDRKLLLNNHHELSRYHVRKMHIHREMVDLLPDPEQPCLRRYSPATPPTTPTRNPVLSRIGSRSTLLQKRGPCMNIAKIRSIDVRYRYFISTGLHPGPLPALCENEPFQKGDLYVHRHTRDEIQVWLMEDDDTWRSIQPGFHHPTLPNYFLNVLPNDGKPNWIVHGTWKGVVRRSRVNPIRKIFER